MQIENSIFFLFAFAFMVILYYKINPKPINTIVLNFNEVV